MSGITAPSHLGDAELLDGPAGLPPPGFEQHVTNTSDEQKWYIVCVVISLTVSGSFLILRLYTKIRIIRRTDMSDYFLMIAFAHLSAFLAVGDQMKKAGGGVHQWNVQLKRMIDLLYWYYINEILYGVIVFFVKVAILLQYLKIFAPIRQVNQVMYFGAWALIVIHFTYYTTVESFTIWACTPREKIWNPLIEGDKCRHDRLVVAQATACFNIASDTIILLLPSWTIWKLHIPLKRKIALISVFAMGLLACGASAAMIVFTYRITAEKDVTYNTLWVGLACCAEISVGIIAASMITLPKFIETIDIRRRFSKVSNLTPFTKSTNIVSRSKSVNTITQGQNLSEINLTYLRPDSASKKDNSSAVVVSGHGDSSGNEDGPIGQV